MEDIINKSILEQLFKYRKDEFEKAIFDSNDEIKSIEENVDKKVEKLEIYLKEFVTDDEKYAKLLNYISEVKVAFLEKEEVWKHKYYELGVSDAVNIKRELKALKKKEEVSDDITFLDYSDTDFTEYIDYKADYTARLYKELQQKYNKIAKTYPNVVKVYEDLEPVSLTKEEMQGLIELIKVRLDMNAYEKKLCFKLGINEALNL